MRPDFIFFYPLPILACLSSNSVSYVIGVPVLYCCVTYSEVNPWSTEVFDASRRGKKGLKSSRAVHIAIHDP